MHSFYDVFEMSALSCNFFWQFLAKKSCLLHSYFFHGVGIGTRFVMWGGDGDECVSPRVTLC